MANNPTIDDPILIAASAVVLLLVFLYVWLLMRTVPTGPTLEEKIEEVAEEIYNKWSKQAGFKPWVEGGNSIMQDRARDMARKDLEEFLNEK